MLVCASVTVFARDPRRSGWYLWRAALAAVPVVGSVAVVKYLPVVFPTIGSAVRIGASTLAFFAFVAFFSIAGHCVIRAFECGRPEEFANKPAPVPGDAPGSAAGA